MQNIQFPLWLAVVISFSGMLGAVLAQGINAWASYLARKQQNATDVAKLQQTELHQWRETKMRVYGQILASMEGMSYLYARMIGEKSRDGREALYVQYEKHWEESREALQEARLIGSKELNDALFDSIRDTIAPPIEVWIDHDPETGPTPVESCTFQKNHLAMFEHCNRLREIARAELGIIPASLE